MTPYTTHQRGNKLQGRRKLLVRVAATEVVFVFVERARARNVEPELRRDRKPSGFVADILGFVILIRV
jgi:hypothetical protein